MKYPPSWLVLCALATSAAAQQPQPASPAQPAPVRPRLDALHDLSSSLESLSRRVTRSVVQIFSTGFVLGGGEEGESADTALVARQQSSGSGVILAPDGYIVTNGHVVHGARRVRVQLPPSPRETANARSILKPAGKLVDAKVVGVDRETDLAVLKIERAGLAHLNLGDSNELRQGQLVMAFGNPLGLQNSVSLGVVSSVARQLRPDDPMVYIQTDAPINPGNSGGPLVDASGRVMGINTFIMTQSGGSEGIGFAIPSNIVRNVYGQIRKDGHMHRGQIGLFAQTITPAMAQGLDLPQDSGVLVGDVVPGGPADSAGVKVGDIVLRLNGKPMENARQLQVDLYRHAIGDHVKLDLLRGADKLTAAVEVIEREDDPQRFADLVDPEKNLVPKLGILGIGIDKRVAEMLGDTRKPYGVVVAAGGGETPFSGGGLQPGDIIYAVNGAPIADVNALRNAVDQAKSGGVLVLQIERHGGLMFVAVEID